MATCVAMQRHGDERRPDAGHGEPDRHRDGACVCRRRAQRVRRLLRPPRHLRPRQQPEVRVLLTSSVLGQAMQLRQMTSNVTDSSTEMQAWQAINRSRWPPCFASGARRVCHLPRPPQCQHLQPWEQPEVCTLYVRARSGQQCLREAGFILIGKLE